LPCHNKSATPLNLELRRFDTVLLSATHTNNCAASQSAIWRSSPNLRRDKSGEALKACARAVETRTTLIRKDFVNAASNGDSTCRQPSNHHAERV
jgi:hypothetical protein